MGEGTGVSTAEGFSEYLGQSSFSLRENFSTEEAKQPKPAENQSPHTLPPQRENPPDIKVKVSQHWVKDILFRSRAPGPFGNGECSVCSDQPNVNDN